MCIRDRVYTDLPGMQLYTANYVEDETGKGGARYHCCLLYTSSGENIYYIEETKLKSLGFLTEKDISALNAARTNKGICQEYERCIEKGIYLSLIHI